MALSPIKKIYLVFLPGDREKLLKLLQKSGVVQPISGRPISGDEQGASFASELDETLHQRLLQAENQVSQLEWAIEYLQKFRKKEHFVEHFTSPQQLISEQVLEKASQFDLAGFTKKLKQLEERKHPLQKQLRQKEYLVKRLRLLKDWQVDLALAKDTQNTFVRFLTVGEHELVSTEAELSASLGERCHIEVLNTRGNLRVLLVIGWKDKLSEFEKWVESNPVEVIQFDELSGTPSSIIPELNDWLKEITSQIQKLENELQKFSEALPELQIAFDYWNNERERLKRMEDLLSTQFSEILIGWVREKDIPSLDRIFRASHLSVGWQPVNPDPQENPPVYYENPPLVQPFEFVTDLYSRPKYWEMDPTPFLSAFFALFFGICLTDAGYGLILTSFTAVGLKKIPFATPNSRKLMKVLFYSGLVTTVVGIFTGGIFGLTVEQLPGALHWLEHLVLLNPLTNQMGFLIFSLALGILHVGLGIFLKFYQNLRSHQAVAAWFDQAPWLAILLGVVALAVSSRMNASWLSSTGYLLMGLAALVILLFAGRSSKNPLLRLAQGLYSLYQVSGLLGDILSYARLFALGLATGVIAGVVNFLAKMTLGIPYLGYLIMPLVLVGGHLMNIVINALGGFIHTSRLQYVEFFGKFYEGGGEPFEPFQLQLKYTKIKDQRLP